MARPRGVIDTERSSWRVPAGTHAVVEAVKAASPLPGAGEWSEGRVVAWAMIALVDQMAQDSTRDPAEIEFMRSRAAALRAVLQQEADAKAKR